MMPESEVLSRMGLGGISPCLDAIKDLLVSMGYEDAARILQLRRPDDWDWDGDDD